MQQGETVNGKKEGLWVSYYANGQKQSEGHYRAGVKVGEWTLYHKNGHKKSEATFVDGQYAGRYVSYHENGNLATEGHYTTGTGTSADDTKEGPWHHYQEDGVTLWRTITYHRGARTKPDDIYATRYSWGEK